MSEDLPPKPAPDASGLMTDLLRQLEREAVPSRILQLAQDLQAALDAAANGGPAGQDGADGQAAAAVPPAAADGHGG